MERAMARIFFTSHEKVSIQDASSCFGPPQNEKPLYLDYFSRKLEFTLEAQAQGPLRRLGVVLEVNSNS
jgi:hypothetical protein